MSQNVRKKRGRPPKADPAAGASPPPHRHLRRSLRRRNVKYVFELDDYFDDDDEVFEDDDERRRKAKKLKLLLNIQSGQREVEPTAAGERRVDRAPYNSTPFPKIGGKVMNTREFKNGFGEDVYCPKDGVSDGDNKGSSGEVTEEQPKHVAEHSPSGNMIPPYGLPLPDKKVLELILNKLQKKDIYGNYAEPVDPEELPDYHDMIEHPMDFATVRNNLRKGSYETMEQFEHDVFLICSNAMQYNEPDTIYYKQARVIKELAIKKFHKIRLEAESSGKFVKPYQKMRPVNGDVRVEGNYFMNENLDQWEMQTGKGRTPPSRFSNSNAFVQDENHRATYNLLHHNHSLDISESLFSTFEGEIKHLVPVGLYSDLSYARSLARFSANLGSVPWKLTSKKIEQALPQGLNFGRGWVGEYEPLPTPSYVLENCTVKEPPFLKAAAVHTKFKNPTSVAEKTSHWINPRVSNLNNQHQKPQSGTSIEHRQMILKQFESASPPTFYKPSAQEQLMRELAEKNQNQQIPSNQLQIDTSSQLLSSSPSSFSNKHLNSQICFGSPYNSFHFIQPQDFPSDNVFPNDMQLHNQQMFYPHPTTADMSRLPIQPTWWNLRPNMDGDFQSSDTDMQLRHFI